MKNVKTFGIASAFLIAVTLMSCGSGKRKLPFLGHRTTVEKVVNGETVVDTVYQTIPDFSFTNQEGQTVSKKDFEGKVYVADFFFTTCPTICPKMSAQMLRLYQRFENTDEVRLLSHSIDTKYDTPPVLKRYAEKLDVKAPKWQFVTGKKEEIYTLGEKHYYVTAQEDKNAPGGFIHSGAFMLIDTHGRIRGKYDGTVPQAVDKLMNDIDLLLQETKEEKNTEGQS
ncbi:SCO family protein [Fulvitalea axinellae]|uniref:SCO family protein n=1 Tax=Fulvitalea axinellae TaxID=1182444 RepID=A0AAU9CT14_9BACT|nr:SCO family protein [Fulvitalea axinellae]